MSTVNETQVFSNSNPEVVEKTTLPDKYIKQMVFGYWIHKHSTERNSTILESIQLHSDIEIQRMFYDEFNENYKVIKADMMMEIKNTKPDEGPKIVKTRSSKSKKTPVVALEKTEERIDDISNKVEEEKIKTSEKIPKVGKTGKVGPKEKVEKSVKGAKSEKPDTPAKLSKSSKGTKSTKMVEKIVESEMVVSEITLNDKIYFMDGSNILYDIETKEVIGHYDAEKNVIV